MKKEKVLALIMARGGSKRIPRKNIKLFLGFPIIKYPIIAAIKAKIFDEVMVSTDDKEIATTAVSFGAAIPFIRSKKNSDDYAMTIDVIFEVIREYRKRGVYFDYICCIYPTAPFITADKLVRSFRLLKEKNADAVIPVMRVSYPFQKTLKIENGWLKMMWPKKRGVRNQDFLPTYHDCGQFYFLKTKSLLAQKRIFAKKTVPFELPETETQDIDNEADWKVAELKYRILRRLHK